MAERKSFLLRLPPDLMEALNRWARDDLRSLNGQIEFLLRDSLRRMRRFDSPPGRQESAQPPKPDPPPPA